MPRPSPALLALAVALAVAACASQGPPRRGGGPGSGSRGFSGLVAEPIALALIDFDLDRDRIVTREELAAGSEQSWRDADADGDGVLAPFEFADWARTVMGSETPTPGRVAFDRNLDETITGAEFLATFAVEFERLDADGDGALERAELVRMIEPGGAPFGAGGEGRRVVIDRRPPG